MNDAIVIAPAKKRKTETDYQNCIICQKKLATDVATPKLDSIKNVFNLSRERHKYGDTAVVKFLQRTVNETASFICGKNGFYHRSF